jgi:hypothetical protein
MYCTYIPNGVPAGTPRSGAGMGMPGQLHAEQGGVGRAGAATKDCARRLAGMPWSALGEQSCRAFSALVFLPFGAGPC